MQNKKAIVTGGAGFIGSHLVEELINQEANVIVIDNLSTGNKENLKQAKTLAKKNKTLFKLYKADIRNIKALEKIFQEFSPIDYVFHEAAIASVPKSIDNPKETFENNVMGTLNLLELSKKYRIKRFIFASSSAVYGNTQNLPIKEEEPLNTLSPYALSKQIGEELLRQFYELYDLETVSLRYFNVFGTRQDPNGPYAAVIPIFIKKILNNEEPTIFGDGLQTRDFIYVKNVTKANIYLAKLDKEKVAGKSFNIAGGNRINLLDLIKNINEILNKNITPKFEESRVGDIKHSYADISKLINLGFSIKTSFSQGLKETIDYYKDNLDK